MSHFLGEGSLFQLIVPESKTDKIPKSHPILGMGVGFSFLVKSQSSIFRTRGVGGASLCQVLSEPIQPPPFTKFSDKFYYT